MRWNLAKASHQIKVVCTVLVLIERVLQVLLAVEAWMTLNLLLGGLLRVQTSISCCKQLHVRLHDALHLLVVFLLNCGLLLSVRNTGRVHWDESWDRSELSFLVRLKMLLVRGLLDLEGTMAVEIFHEVFLAGVAHLFLELEKVVAEWSALLLNQFPGNVLGTAHSLHHIIVVVDLEEPVDDLAVVRHVCILQLANMHHDLLDFFHALGRTDPELLLGHFETLGLDVLDLSDGIVSLLSPFELLVEEVKHCKVETPHVVPPCQIDAHVCVQ